MSEVVNFTPRRRDGFVQTATATDIQSLLSYCASERETGLIVGVPGCGKTAACRQYVEREEGVAALITMGARAARDIDALSELEAALGGRASSKWGKVERHRWIADRLRYGKGDVLAAYDPSPLEPEDIAGPVLLIIDEAHYLEQRAADAIRDLADSVPIGITYVGNSDLIDRWGPARGARREASEQFISRIGPRLNIEYVERADAVAIIAARGIEGAAEADFLLRIAAGDGHLRSLDKVLRFAAHRGGGRPPTLRELELAAAMCGRRW